MIESEFDTWEKRLREIAAEMDYPATPDIVSGVRQRLATNGRQMVVKPWYANRLAWVVTAVLLVAALLLAVPQARAAIFEFFQIGDIRIFPADPAVTPDSEESSGISLTTPGPTAPAGRTAEATILPGNSLANLYGQTDLAELEAKFNDSILLPSYPAGIGLPDQLFFQDQVGPIGILVWLDTADENEAWAVLYTLLLEEGAFGAKYRFQLESLSETEVNGQIAYWVEGQHLLSFYDKDGHIEPQSTRLVEGNTLIWVVDDITYRLETGLSLDEAVRMAESMR